MSEKSFNYFTSLAKNRDNYLEIAGRTNQMQDAEKLIIPDIIQKLDINSKDKILDIGSLKSLKETEKYFSSLK